MHKTFVFFNEFDFIKIFMNLLTRILNRFDGSKYKSVIFAFDSNFVKVVEKLFEVLFHAFLIHRLNLIG